MTAAQAHISSRKSEAEIRNELRVVEHSELFVQRREHVADEITMRAFGSFLWQTKRWWLVAVGAVAALNGALLTLSASWPGGGPAGF